MSAYRCSRGTRRSLAGVAIDEATITNLEDVAATEDTPHQSYASTRVSIQ